MRFACIFIIKIASAVRSAVDLEQSLGMIGQGMQKTKKSMLFLSFIRKCEHGIGSKKKYGLNSSD